MIVCVCKGISHRKIDRLIADGARTVRDLGRSCGAGTDCGCCVDALRSRLQAARTCHEPGACGIVAEALPLAAK